MEHLTQAKYIHDLLDKTRIIGATSMTTPCEGGPHLSKQDGQPMDNPTLYQRTVGALQYLTLTHSKLAFIVIKFSQFMHASTYVHWKAMKHILHYLKGTMHHGFLLSPASSMSLFVITALFDVDCASDQDDKHSTKGFAHILDHVLFLGVPRSRPLFLNTI